LYEATGGVPPWENTYDKEFKIEAVRLASEPGNTAGRNRTRPWHQPGDHQPLETRAACNDGEQAFPGKGRLKPEDDADAQASKRENERLRRERDILKKAVAIFSEDPNRYSDS
jgi:transposase